MAIQTLNKLYHSFLLLGVHTRLGPGFQGDAGIGPVAPRGPRHAPLPVTPKGLDSAPSPAVPRRKLYSLIAFLLGAAPAPGPAAAAAGGRAGGPAIVLPSWAVM